MSNILGGGAATTATKGTADESLLQPSPLGSSMQLLAHAAKIAHLHTQTQPIFETQAFKPVEAPRHIPVILKGEGERLQLNCFKRGWNNFITCCGRSNCCCKRCHFKPPPLHMKKSRVSVDSYDRAHAISLESSAQSQNSIYHSLSSESPYDEVGEQEKMGGGGGEGANAGIGDGTGELPKESKGIGNIKDRQLRSNQRKRGRVERDSLARPNSQSTTVQELPGLRNPAGSLTADSFGTVRQPQRRKAASTFSHSTYSLPRSPQKLPGNRRSYASVQDSRYMRYDCMSDYSFQSPAGLCVISTLSFHPSAHTMNHINI